MRKDRSESSWYIPQTIFLRILIPTLFSSLALSISNIADALTVGNRIGENGLAAIGLITPIFLVYNLIALGFSVGGSVTHVRLTASQQNNLAIVLFRKLLLVLVIISGLIVLIGNVFLDTLLRLLGAGEDYPEIWTMCRQYARPLVSACPVFLVNFLLYYYVQNDDHPRLAALAFTVSSFLDFALNIVFVLFCNWGVRGAVWATILAQLVSILILATHFFGKQGILHLKDLISAEPEKPSEVLSVFRSSTRTGFPSSLTYVFQFGFQLLMNHLLMRAGRMGLIAGDLYVAVYDLILNVSYVVYAVYMAVAESMQPSVVTFSVEQDRDSLRYTRILAIKCGLLGGFVITLVIGLLAGSIASLFGIQGESGLAIAVPAIYIFQLSSYPGGVIMFICRYFQSSRQAFLASVATAIRGLAPIPVALVIGLFSPTLIWWVFPISETLALFLVVLLIRLHMKRHPIRIRPTCRAVLTNDNHEVGLVLDQVSEFCDAHDIPPGKTALLQLAVEELCAVTMQKAFTGKKHEYIQVVLVIEENSYVLHIRDSAPYFNPLNMRMEKANKDMEASLMDSIGVLMIKKKSQSMVYRNYQGFNTITVVYDAVQ